MTSGYADYVQDPGFINAFLANPFRHWTTDELLAYAVNKPLFFEPGTNWAYAHTNYVILGLALEKLTGRSVTDLMQEKVLGPLCMAHTSDPGNSAIPEPVLRSPSAPESFFRRSRTQRMCPPRFAARPPRSMVVRPAFPSR